MKALAWFLALIALLAPARAVAGEDIYEEAAPAAALETDLGAKAYCLIERTTGRVRTALSDIRWKRSAEYGVERLKFEYDDLARIAKANDMTLEGVRRLAEQAKKTEVHHL